MVRKNTIFAFGTQTKHSLFYFIGKEHGENVYPIGIEFPIGGYRDIRSIYLHC